MAGLAVTGAGGFIGRALIRRLSERGIPARAIVRTPMELRLPGVQFIAAGDLAKADLAPLFEGCDVVVNLAALVHRPDAAPEAHLRANRDLPLRLARAARGKRFVQLSSVSAIASVTAAGEMLDDGSAPRPSGPYGQSKLAADEALAKAGVSFVALRPPTVYGPGVPAQFRRLMNCARWGIRLPLGGVANARSMIFAGNLADAIVAAAFGKAEGAFIVTDSSPVSTASLYHALLAAYGRGTWLPSLPAAPLGWLTRAALGDRAESLLASSAFDGSRFAETFGWHPATGFDEAIRLTVDADR